ncbi:MAG: hypothetical protein ACYC6S_04000 [Desulfobulbia bacterium]
MTGNEDSKQDLFNEPDEMEEPFSPLEVEIGEDFASKNPDVVKELSKHQLLYSIGGLILGVVCMIGGIVLFLNGVTGATSWTAKLLGAESQFSDAAPGAVLFIVGLFIVLITKYVFNVKKNA